MDGHSEAIVDLAAVRSNVAAMAQHVKEAQVMAVVKSDGYGHGMLDPDGQAALAAARPGSASAIPRRRSRCGQPGITVPVLCLLAAPDALHREAIAAGVDLSAGTASLVRQIGVAAAAAGRPARLHLKVDTGMSRGGAPMAQWPG